MFGGGCCGPEFYWVGILWVWGYGNDELGLTSPMLVNEYIAQIHAGLPIFLSQHQYSKEDVEISAMF